MTMMQIQQSPYIFLVGLALLGCGETPTTGSEEATARAESPSASARTYDEDVRLKACEAMPLEVVLRVFDVPAEEVETGGGKYACRYQYEDDDRTFYAALERIQVFDDVEQAKRRYADFTKDATREEVDDQKAEIDREVEKDEELGAEEKKTAGTITGLMAALTPGGGLRHETVEGLGDEAKIDNENATLRIRSGNMFFYLRAYHGPKQPNPGTTKLDEIMAAERAWNVEALPDRTRAAIALAREVVPRMEGFAD